MAKLAKATAAKASQKKSKQQPSNQVKATAVKSTPKLVRAEAPAKTAEASSAKKLSAKFLEAIERRKSSQGERKDEFKPFAKPAGRRGRKPKNLADYTPAHQEEESYVLESEMERLEYDTGIRAPGGGDDAGFSMDRVDDFDEELNFER